MFDLDCTSKVFQTNIEIKIWDLLSVDNVAGILNFSQTVDGRDLKLGFCNINLDHTSTFFSVH